MASGGRTSYDDLKSDIEEVIKSTVRRDVELELDDDFFATVEYKVMCMAGAAGIAREDEQKLISENETRFENVSDHKALNFTFTSSYQENSTLNLVASSGWCVGIGSSLGGGGMGATGGVNATGSYGRSKKTTTASERGETKTLEFSGAVDAGCVVTVKELTYNVTRKRQGDIELYLTKKSEVPYIENEDEGKVVKVTKSLMKKLSERKGISIRDNNLVISLSGPFVLRKVMRNLRVQQVELEEKRKTRITAPADAFVTGGAAAIGGPVVGPAKLFGFTLADGTRI
jgi:hypothetical protein